MFRPLLAASVLAQLLLPASAAPQDPRADLRVELAAKEPARVAWAAWNAAEQERRELAGELRAAALRVVRADVDKTTTFVMRSLLDALIRLEAPCEPAELAEFAKLGILTDTVCVLASQDARSARPFLEPLFERSTDVHVWNLCANLFARELPAEFAPRFVPLAQVAITVIVRDPNAGFSGGRSTGIGCGSLEAPEGFPPTVIYSLQRHERTPKTTLLADGPVPIGCERTVRTERTFGLGGRTEELDKPATALGLLRRLAGDRPGHSALKSEIEILHTWTAAANYRRQVQAELDLLRTSWKSLLEELQHAELISAELAETPPPFQVTISDRRSSKLVPLPELK